jgi:hypothetical protein
MSVSSVSSSYDLWQNYLNSAKSTTKSSSYDFMNEMTSTDNAVSGTTSAESPVDQATLWAMLSSYPAVIPFNQSVSDAETDASSLTAEVAGSTQSTVDMRAFMPPPPPAEASAADNAAVSDSEDEETAITAKRQMLSFVTDAYENANQRNDQSSYGWTT